MSTSDTTIVIKGGSLYGTGWNGDGQLTDSGDKTSLTKIEMPTTMSVNVKPKYIACGSRHTVVLMTDGSLYGTGKNGYGQLGLGDTVDKTVLTKIDMPVNVKPKYIACGSDHTVVLMTDGSLYGTGNNTDGQLTDSGDKTSLTKIEMPTTMSVNVKPKYIACGSYHTVVLMTDGSLYGTGKNTDGQLTDSGDKTSLTKIDMPTTMSVNVKPKYIACGNLHTVVLMTDGSLYGTGNNYSGQLTGTSPPYAKTELTEFTTSDGLTLTPKYIACGGSHTVVLMTDGFLYGTGNNFNGQLTGTGNKSSLTPIPIPTIPAGLTPKYISCGENHTVVLMTDGSLYGTGKNGYGQLGLGDTVDKTVLKSISDGVSYIADMMDYVDIHIHNYTVYFMKSY